MRNAPGGSKKKKRTRVVVDDPDNTVTKPVLAEAIVTISKGVTALRRSGLNEKAIITLVSDSTRPQIGKATVAIVIEALGDLAKNYTR